MNSPSLVDTSKDILSVGLATCDNCNRTELRCEMFPHGRGMYCIGCEQIWDESHPVRDFSRCSN